MLSIPDYSDRYWTVLRGGDTGWPFKQIFPCVGEIRHPETLERLAGARSRWAPYDPASERPLMLYDTTSWGKGKFGLLITDKAVYGGWGMFKAQPGRLSLAEFSDLTVARTAFEVRGKTLAIFQQASSYNLTSTLERMVLEDYLAGLKDPARTIDETRIRRVLKPADANVLTRELAALGADILVLLGVLYRPFEDERIIARVDDLVITNHRIVRLPDKVGLIRDEGAAFHLVVKSSTPEHIGHTPHVSNPVAGVAVSVAKIAFNEISKRNHISRILEYKGELFGLHRVLGDPDKVELTYTWRPDKTDAAIDFAERLEAAGITVRRYGFGD